ncbi:Aste57867_18677 [Aphanomyces stellatus]|uniref:Aste57867_18677 protein n=1 Tax=Aphanomyces stellatus TaxID=120398 RepID=A0A485LER0_9STRA|nr:hypothetical protein As57867_018615 [Aphanomyces stellatus]VFT95412.1 Aste57867_18677 [Aphanomyces stellatus]
MMMQRRLLRSAFNSAAARAPRHQASRWMMAGVAATAGCTLSLLVSQSSPALCVDQPPAPRRWRREPLPKNTIVALASLINAAVDIPGMDEDEEQEIIQSAVEVIITEMEDFLPRSYWERTNCKMQPMAHGGRRDVGIMTTKIVPDAQRELMEARLVEHFQRTLHFPYLSAQDQDLIVHATVAILSDSMTGTSLDEILARKSTSVSLVAIFIREAMGIDNVEDLRNEVIGMIELPIPLPEPLVKYVLSKGVTMLVTILNDAVDNALAECFGPMPSREIATPKEFEEVLRINVVSLLYAKFDLFLLPRFVERFLISKIVDTYFEICVTQTRIDDAVSMLLKSKAEATAAA